MVNKVKRRNIAVTEMVGTMLLLVISIAIFSVLYLSVVTVSPNPAQPSVDLICTLDNENITVEHRGGETLDLDTIITVTINDVKEEFVVEKHMVNKFKEDGVWNIGERVNYSTGDVTDLKVSVSVVDKSSNSVIMMADLQE
jgi:hypothetical protein